MSVQVPLNYNSVDDYKLFLKIKSLPAYSFVGRTAIVPDRYAEAIGMKPPHRQTLRYRPRSSFLFDYQRAIAKMAIKKRKFCMFADCGLGKTLVYLEWAKHVSKVTSGAILMICPLMVVEQIMDEVKRFYGDTMPWEYIRSSNLQGWLNSGGRFGITNYEALTQELTAGRLDAMIIDESSMLKSHYGKWGTRILQLGRGLEWKICGTGTPAPNDRIEYANHAVFMDAFPNVNSFLARFFVNRGQTSGRWEMKAHAVEPFYRALSDWSIFLANPAVYGWKDHSDDIPPIHVHIEHVPLTQEQYIAIGKVTNQLFVTEVGGIGTRSKLSQISKGRVGKHSIPENKTAYIRSLIDSWPDESTIIWCLYNAEQETMARAFPDAANIAGSTPHTKRLELLADFKSGRTKVLITKPKILGYGLNLQVATRQIFSGLQDSYESYYQAVKRSNRVGSTKPLNVHIPVTDAEWPMVQTVIRKSKQVQQDTEAQERIFRQHAWK